MRNDTSHRSCGSRVVGGVERKGGGEAEGRWMKRWIEDGGEEMEGWGGRKEVDDGGGGQVDGEID